MSEWTAPAQSIKQLSLSDSADNCEGSRALYIGVAGNVKLTDARGNTVTIGVQAGLFPVMCKRVWNTGTTATGIFALY